MQNNDDAPVIEIREAEREGARLVLGLAGWTGSGKTYTALQLAYGLANYNTKKIGFLDAENRRGSLYADLLPAKFYIADLFAPFSPERYVQAILTFQRAGVEVLIIDSTTHEWEGIGGCHDIAHNSKSKIDRWDAAKERHKDFMNCLLQSPMHIICCIRAREKAHPEKVRGDDGKDKTIYVNDGLQPVQEKNFMFEMTASLMMLDEGKKQDVLKCPEALRHLLGRKDGYITAADGKKIREWVDGAKQLDPEAERWRNVLQNTASQGVEPLKKMWEKEVPKPIKKALGEAFIASTKASAEAFDKKRAEEVSTGNSVVDELNAAGSKPAVISGNVI